MKIAIFGLPFSGKTTVFNCLTRDFGHEEERGGSISRLKAKVRSSLAVVKVPDERVDKLREIYKPRKTTYAEIVFEDISTPEDRVSSAVLDAHGATCIRNADVAAIVLRNFLSPLLDAPPDPVRDFTSLEDEFLLADLGIVERRLDRLVRERSAGVERKTLEKCIKHLEEGYPLRILELTRNEMESIKGYGLLTLKKLLVLVNTSEDAPMDIPEDLAEAVFVRGSAAMSLCGSLEAEIANLSPEEADDFLKDLGVEQSGRERFIRHAFKTLGLISFLTTGEDECRAWPVTAGTSAHQAASVIHSDIQRGFIRAEVLSFEDFMANGGSEKKAKAAGRYRLEGKDYIVRDGDIISFRFNV